MQKEKLSALMDGEGRDVELLCTVAHDKSLQQCWENYHLIRDVMRGSTADVLHLDIADRVMATLEREFACAAPSHNKKLQRFPRHGQMVVLWKKIRPWTGALIQVGVAACVSMAVILGVQHYNNVSDTPVQPETPVFNTLPMIDRASPASLGVSPPVQPQYLQEQQHRNRMNVLIQDYELQRRLHAERRLAKLSQTQQAFIHPSGHSTSKTQKQQ